jgi:oligopeptide/dipeptide ABC transporter ATP-binding protein
MRQRVMIAIGLSCEPDLLIADEPTTALDVTTQAQLLDLLDRVREQTGTATLLITHDLAVVAGFAQHVVVMYAGQVVESASVRDVFARPAHPYTKALLRSLPGAPGEPGKRSRLCALDGRVPSLVRLPTGCRFRARCSRAQDRCAAEGLTLRGIGEARWVRCHFPEGDAT